MKLALIGPMGAGKTTLARRLFEILPDAKLILDEDRSLYYPRFGYTKERQDYFLEKGLRAEMIRDRAEIDVQVLQTMLEISESQTLILDVAPALVFLKSENLQKQIFAMLSQKDTKVVLVLPKEEVQTNTLFLYSRLEQRTQEPQKAKALRELNTLFLQDPFLHYIKSKCEKDATRFLRVTNEGEIEQTLAQVKEFFFLKT